MWCHNDKQNFETSSQGQINENTEVGQFIIDFVKKAKLSNIIDIGTWNGLGSTKCFLLALQKNHTTKFISIESNNDKVSIARQNLKELLNYNANAKICWGSILKTEEVSKLDLVFPSYSQNSEFQRWHGIDMANIEHSPYILDELPSEIDFVLFDGGEFTTHFEFVKIFSRCKKFIALDDVNVDKCITIRRFLKHHPEWKEIKYINERNGFSLFEKVDTF